MKDRASTFVVVGGGITGLAAAHRILELAREHSLNVQLLLLEAGDRLGGVIRTNQRDGFLIEGGPDSMISEKPWALELSKRLGLERQLIGTNPKNRQALVARKGKLHPMPEGFHLITPSRIRPFLASSLFSWLGKIRMALEIFVPAKRSDKDESVASFVRRRFGRQAVKRIAQPMVGGIYTADVRKLSLMATMPQFRELELQYGSLIKGLRHRQRERGQRERAAFNSKQSGGARYDLFLSFKDGMQTLTDALTSALPPRAASLRARVYRLRFEPGRNLWAVGYGENQLVRATGICLAVPAPRAAKILADAAPDAANEMKSIRYASSATVNLTYERKDIPHKLDGFGFVVPPSERRSILACTFSSVKYAGRAPRGQVLLRAFLGGDLQPEVLKLEDRKMEQAVRDDLQHYLGIKAAPRSVWVRRFTESMAQYDVGHLDKVDRIEKMVARRPGLTVAGSAFRGIGIPDCVRSGELAAEALLKPLIKKRLDERAERANVPALTR